jgi:hypothetical protein
MLRIMTLTMREFGKMTLSITVRVDKFTVAVGTIILKGKVQYG